MERLSDTLLLERFANGDRSSLEELISRYADKVFRLACRFTRNESDAEDVLQDVFLTVFTKVGRFEGKSAFSSWLYRVTVNNALMKLRKRKVRDCASFDAMASLPAEAEREKRPEADTIEYLSTRHELRSKLLSAVENLPEDYRAIFMLRDVDGLSNQEVSEIMKMSVPAVKSRLHRSRSLLRRDLAGYYAEYSGSEVPVDYLEAA